MHDVFLSHSSVDRLTAEAACHALEAAGVRVWMASRDVVPGTPYGRAIIEAIKACRLMIVIFSEQANTSEHVAREVELAARERKPLLPMRVASIEPSGELMYFLGRAHWLDALTPPVQAHLSKLVAAVQTILAREPARAPAPTARAAPPEASRAVPPSSPAPHAPGPASADRSPVAKPFALAPEGAVHEPVAVPPVAIPATSTPIPAEPAPAPLNQVQSPSASRPLKSSFRRIKAVLELATNAPIATFAIALCALLAFVNWEAHGGPPLGIADLPILRHLVFVKPQPHVTPSAPTADPSGLGDGAASRQRADAAITAVRAAIAGEDVKAIEAAMRTAEKDAAGDERLADLRTAAEAVKAKLAAAAAQQEKDRLEVEANKAQLAKQAETTRKPEETKVVTAAPTSRPSISAEQRAIVDMAVRLSLKLADGAPVGEAELGRVDYLLLSGEEMTDQLLSWLTHPATHAPSIRRLVLLDTGVTVAGLRSLAAEQSGLKKLTSLSLRGEAITDEALRIVTGKGSVLAAIEKLSLESTSVTDAGLRSLAGSDTVLTKLTDLTLLNSKFTDAGVAEVASQRTGLSAVTTLLVGGKGITDASLRAVSARGTGLRRLQSFSIGSDEITDAGVRAFAATDCGIIGLKELKLFGSPATDATIAALKARWPGISVVR